MVCHLEALDETDIKEFSAVERRQRLSSVPTLLNDDDSITKILSLKKWVH